MDNITILRGENRVYVEREDGQLLGEITFEPLGECWIADHSFVDPALRGKGIAEQLLQALAQAARDEGKKIIPECPYVVRKFRTDHSYDDVKAQN